MSCSFFLLGNSSPSEFYVQTFRNTLSVPSSYVFAFFILGDSPASEFYVPTFRNTVCSEGSAQNSDAGESRKINNTISP